MVLVKANSRLLRCESFFVCSSRSARSLYIYVCKNNKALSFRFIILHAGGQDGFIDGSSLIFKSKTTAGDYHGEMNSENFENWLRNSLLPNLNEPSIIVLDNASYHSRLLEKWPAKNWKKDEMRKWLEEKKIHFEESDTKVLLWNRISLVPKGEKIFVTDKLIGEAGHQVLRLPPYHCQFNAIEMVWSQSKRLYDQLILKEKDILATWQKALDNVSKEQWANYVAHTDSVIRAAYEKEKDLITSLDQVQPLIINFDSDSDSDLSDII